MNRTWKLGLRMEWATTALLAASVLLLASGCVSGVATPAVSTQGAANAASASEARVFFNNVIDGASVASPLVVTMASENFTIVPAGEAKAGEGHLHIMVDTDCVAAGAVIPKDDAHLHFGQGQLEAELTLARGEHTLCLQAADGAHIALAGDGMRQQIRVTVGE